MGGGGFRTPGPTPSGSATGTVIWTVLNRTLGHSLQITLGLRICSGNATGQRAEQRTILVVTLSCMWLNFVCSLSGRLLIELSLCHCHALNCELLCNAPHAWEGNKSSATNNAHVRILNAVINRSCQGISPPVSSLVATAAQISLSTLTEGTLCRPVYCKLCMVLLNHEALTAVQCWPPTTGAYESQQGNMSCAE